MVSSSSQRLLRSVSTPIPLSPFLHTLPVLTPYSGGHRLNARHLLHTKVNDSVTLGGNSYRSEGTAANAHELNKFRTSAAVAMNQQFQLQIHREVVTDAERVRLYSFVIISFLSLFSHASLTSGIYRRAQATVR